MAKRKPKAKAKAAKAEPSLSDKQVADILAQAETEPAKAKGGRPTKCTPALLEKIELLMINGAHPDAAVLALGVSKDSKVRWEDRGRADLVAKRATPFAQFCLLLDRAPAVALVAVDVKVHQLAAHGDTTAAKMVYQRLDAPGFKPQNVSLFPPGEIADDDDTLRAELTKRLAGRSEGASPGGSPG